MPFVKARRTPAAYIETDAGINGWGEVDSRPSVVKAVIEAPLSHQICNGLANALIGADPLAVEACMAHMDAAANYYGRVGVGAHAMAGINQALWDIAGKAHDAPIYQLFGVHSTGHFEPTVLFYLAIRQKRPTNCTPTRGHGIYRN